MVYVITDGTDFVKIGFAKRLKPRLSQLQIGNPRKLVVLATIETGSLEDDELLEKVLHNLLIGYKVELEDVKKTEWFELRAYEIIKSKTEEIISRACGICGIHAKVKCVFGDETITVNTHDRTVKFKSRMTSMDLYRQQYQKNPKTAKFSVGETVGTKVGLKSGKMYGCFFFSERMATLRSRVQSVHRNEYGFYYKLDNGISYSEEMLGAV